MVLCMSFLETDSKPPYEKTGTNKPYGPDRKASSGHIAAAP